MNDLVARILEAPRDAIPGADRAAISLLGQIEEENRVSPPTRPQRVTGLLSPAPRRMERKHVEQALRDMQTNLAHFARITTLGAHKR